MSSPTSPDDRAPLDDAIGQRVDTLRQRLVAYLDGELSAEESRAVEAELASDELVRRELQQLDRVWNALDALPRATVDDQFTRSTVEMITLQAKQEVEQLTAALPVQRRRRGYRMTAVCLAALMLGIFLARGMATRSDRRVLAALPVIYQYDALRQFRDIEFLRQLRSEAPTFVAEFSEGQHQGVPVTKRVTDWHHLAAGSMAERADWVAKQSNSEKLRLQRATERFQTSSESSRESAATQLMTLREQPDAEDLLTTALAYDAWLATKTATLQSELRQITDPAQRLAKINRLYRGDRFKAERTLSQEDVAAIREAIKDLADDPEVIQFQTIVQQRLERARGGRGGNTNRGGNANHRRKLTQSVVVILKSRAQNSPAGAIALMAQVIKEQPDGLPQRMRLVLGDDAEAMHELIRETWPRLEQRLLQELSPAARDQLEQKNAQQRASRLRTWIIEANKFRRPDDEALEAFFASDSLIDSQRHEMLSLPTEEMKRRLAKLYLRQEYGTTAADDDAGGRGERRGRSGRTRRGERPRGEGARGEGARGERPRGEGPRGEGLRGEGLRGERPRGERIRGERLRSEGRGQPPRSSHLLNE